MKSSAIIGLLSLAITAQAFADNQTSVTIYNSNNAVVREFRTLDLKKGLKSYSEKDFPSLLDPASVKLNLTNADIIEQNFKFDLASASKILQKYIDKDVILSKDEKSISGKLISADFDGAVIQTKEGGLILVNKLNEYTVSVPTMPAGFIVTPTLEWLIDSKSSGKKETEINYQTNGMTWNAEYVAVLNKDEKTMDLTSWISLTNTCGKTFENAKIKLMAGNIAFARKKPQYNEDEEEIVYTNNYAPKELLGSNPVSEKSFFEYHLYNIARPTTIANNESKQVTLFDKQNIKIEKEYLYEVNSYYSYEANPDIYVKFKNSEKNNLGIPLPKGVIRIYKDDGTDKEMIGSANINHTPKDEELKLKVGKAFDLLVKDKVVSTDKISDEVSEIEIETELKNRKKEDVVIKINKNFYSNVEVLKSNYDSEKKDNSVLEFSIPVKADSVVKLKYKVRTKKVN
jgi:hypothetical protein